MGSFVFNPVSLANVLTFKGSLDCSANPNYPSASTGDTYVVNVAGKIGGASGTVVSAGDEVVAIAANAGGTQASVGSSWNIIEANLPGFSIGAGKTVAINNSLTFTGTDGQSFAFPNGSDTVVTLGAAQTLTSKTLTSAILNGFLSGSALAFGIVATTVNNSTNVLADITGLSFAIGASENWIALFAVTCTGNAAGVGVKLGLSGPTIGAGSVRMTIIGEGSGASAFNSETLTAFGSASANTYVAGSTLTGPILVLVAVQNGANAGTIKLQFLSSTNGTQVSALLNSWMIAVRKS